MAAAMDVDNTEEIEEGPSSSSAPGIGNKKRFEVKKVGGLVRS